MLLFESLWNENKKTTRPDFCKICLRMEPCIGSLNCQNTENGGTDEEFKHGSSQGIILLAAVTTIHTKKC